MHSTPKQYWRITSHRDDTIDDPRLSHICRLTLNRNIYDTSDPEVAAYYKLLGYKVSKLFVKL